MRFIEPLNDRILVLPDEPMKRTKGGLELADISLERPVKGTVISVGSKVQDRNLRDDCRVLYGKFSGSEIEIEGHEFLLLREDEIMAIESEIEIDVDELVRGIRGVLREELEPVSDPKVTEASGDSKLARPALECPACFKKFNDAHSCARADFKVIPYEDLEAAERARQQIVQI